MVSTRVFLKAGFALTAMIGGVSPLAADEAPARSGTAVLGAPATPDQQYLGKKFNFSPSELTERQRLLDGSFNYSPELDKLTVQSAK